MDAKEYLRSVRTDESRYISKCERLRDAAGYGTGRKEAERLSGSSTRSRVEDNVCALVDLERETQSRAGNIADSGRRAEAIELIRQIPREIYRETLFLYYCENLSWKQVASTIGRTERQTFQIHGWGLQVFGAILKERENDGI